MLTDIATEVKSKMIGLKDQDVTCHAETPDVLYIGTEQGKLYLIDKSFAVICVIQMNAFMVSISCLNNYNYIIVSLEENVLRCFNCKKLSNK